MSKFGKIADAVFFNASIYFMPYIPTIIVFFMFGDWRTVINVMSLLTFFMYPMFVWTAMDLRDRRNERLSRDKDKE